MSYTIGERRTILVVDYHLFASDLAEQLRRLGYSIVQVSPDQLSVASFQGLTLRHRPALVLAINFAAALAALCSGFSVPYVTWTIDPLPPDRLCSTIQFDPKLCLAFAHRRSLVEQLSSMGCRAHYLPLAAPPRRHPIQDQTRLERWRCGVSFVGGSLASDVEQFESWQSSQQLSGRIRARLNHELRELFERDIDDLNFCGLTPHTLAAAGPTIGALAARTPPNELCYLLNGQLGYWQRRRVIEALEPLDLVVHGDDGFSRFARGYRGLAEHTEELTAIYNASRVNVDMPRLYQREIITMRVFDVLACGGLVLTEHQPEVTRLFEPGKHLATYRDIDELVRVTRELCSNPERAAEMGLRGRDAVLASHTIAHRVTTILDACSAEGWL